MASNVLGSGVCPYQKQSFVYRPRISCTKTVRGGKPLNVYIWSEVLATREPSHGYGSAVVMAETLGEAIQLLRNLELQRRSVDYWAESAASTPPTQIIPLPEKPLPLVLVRIAACYLTEYDD